MENVISGETDKSGKMGRRKERMGSEWEKSRELEELKGREKERERKRELMRITCSLNYRFDPNTVSMVLE